MTAHLREQWRKTAVNVVPLRVGQGVFWRLHPKGRSFDVGGGGSKIHHDDPTGLPDALTQVAEGYSCFSNPWHLYFYVQEMGWDVGRSVEVVGFEGTIVGAGWDGEPTVRPRAMPFDRMPWDDFEVRLEITDAPPSPWYEGINVGGFTLGKQASTWRGFSDEPFFRQYDAVIATQMRGRQRYYEVWTYGQNFANYPRLDEAKAGLEAIYGPLGWERVEMPPVWVEHYYFGLTDEFTDPLTIYVVPSLPKLGKQASSRVEKLIGLLRDTGTVDAAKMLWEDEYNAGDIATEFDYALEPTEADLSEARRIISRESQALLRSIGLGERLVVYRSGPVGDGPVSTSLNKLTAGYFGEPVTYEIDLSDVLYFSELLWTHGTFAEQEVGVMGRDLRRVRIGKQASFLSTLPVRDDPNLGNEARSMAERGYIAVGPKFHALSESQQTAVLWHEAAHFYGLDDLWLARAEDWNLAAKCKYGHLNGQTTPGEIVAEAYSVLKTERPGVLDQFTYEGFAAEVAALAREVGLP